MAGSDGGVVYLEVPRLPSETLDRFARVSVASISQAGGAALLDRSIQPRLPGIRVSGCAITCECAPGDNLTLHRAITLCGRGDILIAVAHSDSVAVWGGLMSIAARIRGVGGAIVDGLIRDATIIRQLGFPLWSRGVFAAGPAHVRFGSVNTPVTCGGTLVKPGDVVVADEDGVAVVPRLHAERVLAKVDEVERREHEYRERMMRGDALYELLGLDAVASRGSVVEMKSTWETSRGESES